MPELPDIEAYLHALRQRLDGEVVRNLRIASPSVLRTHDPSYETVRGRTLTGLRRLGKRIVFELDEEVFLVVHLMVAGRLRWETPKAPIPKKVGLAAVDFDPASLILTEQGSRRRAGIWLVQGGDALDALDPGGIEPLEASVSEFSEALKAENRTLKRALTDPRILSGIGNAYSDEILWRAGLSPVKRTAQLTDEEAERLHRATVETLEEWTRRLVDEVGDGWPAKVTAFRPDMAVHGKYGQPCPRCGSPVQRIVFANRETNYCPACQTEGRLLADRALSRLLKADWPKTLDELEG